MAMCSGAHLRAKARGADALPVQQHLLTGRYAIAGTSYAIRIWHTAKPALPQAVCSSGLFVIFASRFFAQPTASNAKSVAHMRAQHTGAYAKSAASEYAMNVP